MTDFPGEYYPDATAPRDPHNLADQLFEATHSALPTQEKKPASWPTGTMLGGQSEQVDTTAKPAPYEGDAGSESLLWHLRKGKITQPNTDEVEDPDGDGVDLGDLSRAHRRGEYPGRQAVSEPNSHRGLEKAAIVGRVTGRVAKKAGTVATKRVVTPFATGYRPLLTEFIYNGDQALAQELIERNANRVERYFTLLAGRSGRALQFIGATILPAPAAIEVAVSNNDAFAKAALLFSGLTWAQVAYEHRRGKRQVPAHNDPELGI
jgi:hypothetical protein